jgi:UDP-GlcNAc:undecaprenyl-phosphate GlcNAc-1-phosphate transferase
VKLILGSLVTCLLGLALTPIIRSYARRRGIVAKPRDDRWHKQPTALLGGLAIYGAFVGGFLAFTPYLPGGARLILAGGSLLFLIGLVDDFVSLKAPIKLALQLIVASLVVYFGRRLPWTDSAALNIFITIFWLVGITNAINLLDNMDGLAAGIAAIACAFMTFTFLLNGQMGEALLPALLGGAALGFLFFNLNPASIFMGDCGSMFLGFSLGGMALLSTYDRTRHLGTVLITPVLIMLIPIFDTLIVTVSRKLSGRSVAQGGRDHTSHRLVALGMSERRAVFLLYSLAYASGMLALVVRQMRLEVMLTLVAIFILVLFLIGIYLGGVRVYEEGDEQQSDNAMLRALVGFQYKRRMFEIVLDAVLIALAYHSAYLLRFDGAIPEEQMAIFLQTLPLVIATQMFFFLIGDVYGGLWRYIGIPDLVAIGRAVVIGGAASAFIVFALFSWRGPSRAVFILDPLLLVCFVGASRLSFRLLRAIIVGGAEAHPEARPVLIYGAGDGGELLLREILNNPEYKYAPVGFIDDDLAKIGQWIHGYRIFDSRQLPKLVERHGVSRVLVSSAKVPDSKLSSLRHLGLDFGRLHIRIEVEYVQPGIPEGARKDAAGFSL